MQNKKQISQTRRTIGGTMLPNRQTILRLISIIIIVAILFLGNSSPVSATTPADSAHGIEKPAELVLWTPWGTDVEAKANGSLYNEGAHTDTYNQYYAIDFNPQPPNEGGNVYPARNGYVAFAGSKTNNTLGNFVVLRHEIPNHNYYYYTLYAHLKTIAVNAGTEILRDGTSALGTEGGTNGTSVPYSTHLHFAVFRCEKKDLNGNDVLIPNELYKNNSALCESVVPEPLIGREVYEGFGLSKYNHETLLIGSNPGAAAALNNVTWENTLPSGSTVEQGGEVVFSIKDLPTSVDNIKEVRFTAWYNNPATGTNGWSSESDDAFNENWRILAKCSPNIENSDCAWGEGTLRFTWKPYVDEKKLVVPWLPAGNAIYSAYKISNDQKEVVPVCISFDIFDNAGNVAYAPAGWLGDACDTPSAVSDLQATSSVAVDSARLIYLKPVFSSSTDNILPTGYWTSPSSSGQTVSSNTVTLTVNASDNPGGSGVREVRWAAKYNGNWYGIGTDYDAPYSINWDWCAAGAQNGDVELGFEVWDNANDKPWVYSQNAPAGNFHVNKNYNCDNGGGSINWSANFYNGQDHWWDPNNTSGHMCSDSFSQGNLDRNYGDGSPCPGGATDNWIGDYKATVNFLPGNYSFWVDHDDGLKLRVDGREIYSVNGTHQEWKCVDNNYMYLSGNHNIWAILAEQGGGARIKVEWSKNNGVCDLPAAFNKSSPINGLGYQSLNPTLSWGATGGASSYSYCYDTTNDNSCDNPNWYGASTATSVNLTGLSPATTYYWQVKAYSQGGAGSEADAGVWWSFTTQADPPAAFNKVSPANASNAQLANPALAWAASTGASWYQYCYDTTNDNTCDNDMWFSAGTDTSAYITNLTESTTYYWQVRSNNAGGTTYANGNVWWSFTTYPAQTLTVNKTGAGSGTVTSSPAGINCGTTCSSVYPYNTVVTLTATPTADHIFAGWSGGGCSGTGTCIVTMNAAKSITATFNLPSHTLTVSKTGLGTGLVTSLPVGINCGATCSYAFVQNTIVTLTAAPIAPAAFGGWSGACSGTGTCTVTMNAAKSVTATFYYPNQTLTVSKAGTGSGTVTSSPAGINCGTACSYAYTYNTVVTLTPAPKPMSIFSGWSGACTGTGTCKVTMSTAKSVTATFTFRPTRGDYTGDGKTDVAVFRPSNNTWYIKGLTSVVYGTTGDIPVPADYNGDGKMDIAQFRPSTGTWYIYDQTSVVYGSVGDVPIVADFNGDFKAEIAVYRPSNGMWYIKGQEPFAYGNVGDKPVVADYNGDGKSDIAVFRPSNSTWYIKDQGSFVYGAAGDIPVVADYSGDGKADIAVFRPSNSTWYIRGMSASLYGGVGDKPVVADYNGDGKADIAIFRPSNSTWYIKGGSVSVYGWIGDIPVVK